MLIKKIQEGHEAYHVTILIGTWESTLIVSKGRICDSCNCKGFIFRRKCTHIERLRKNKFEEIKKWLKNKEA